MAGRHDRSLAESQFCMRELSNWARAEVDDGG